MSRSARHTAPAVRYPVGRSAWLAGMLGLWSLAGLLVLVAWTALGASSHPRSLIGGAFLLWLLASTAAWRFWARLPVGLLAWDDGTWELHSLRVSGLRGTLTVHLDLQRHLAVCLHPEGARPQWVWLERHRAPHHWDELRRAVYSRPGTGIADTAFPVQRPSGPL